jgi:hypothetical protein
MCGEVFVHLQEQLVMPQSLFPRRYYIDDDGRRVLIGLTVEQTREFELLELPEPSPGIDQASLNHGLARALSAAPAGLGNLERKEFSARSVRGAWPVQFQSSANLGLTGAATAG